MTLDELPLGLTATITSVEGRPRFRERLVELGFVPGTPVRARRRAPLGDPIQVEVRGGKFALRRTEARSIHVQIPEASAA